MQVQTTQERMSAETAAMWRRYKKSGDPRDRDRLVMMLTPLVRHVVSRKLVELPSHFEADDFISAGLEALIKAIDRFDPEHGTLLESYAWARIHGAIIDELRKADWAPRSVRRWQREAGRARARFTAEHGRRPTAAELGVLLSMSTDEVLRRTADLRAADVGSLNAPVRTEDEDTIEVADTLAACDASTDPEHAALRRDTTNQLITMIRRLPERDRQVMALRFLDDQSLAQIGRRIGVTESRVSQMITAITKRMHSQLAGQGELVLAAVS